MTTAVARSPPSLLEYLTTQLTKTFPGRRSLQLQCLRSIPRRSHALFPHATNLKTKVYQQEVLVVLSESLNSSSIPSIPIFALEASIYTIPSTSTSLIYISKVDTTGLLPSTSSSPSPASALVSAFLTYHILHPPNKSKRVRIHVFAKSQPQYLFPGSVENKDKKVLDDKALIRWWKKCISTSVGAQRGGGGTEDSSVATLLSTNQLRLFYLIPGLSYAESLPYVPLDPSSLAPAWTYSHPYSTLPSPLFLTHPAGSTPPTTSIGDHIPSFPDDPKSRFQTSLTSSSVASAGDPNDYDDVMSTLSSTAFTSLSSGLSQRDMVERERTRERTRLNEGVVGGVEEWWERMAWRQECCSGVLVGFFVVSVDRSTPGTVTDAAELRTKMTTMTYTAPDPYPAAIPHANFTALWSQFHNVDYAITALPRLHLAASKWTADVHALVVAEGWSKRIGGKTDKIGKEESDANFGEKDDRESMYGEQVFRIVEVDNAPLLPREKRGMDAVEVKVVNKMVPRKKVKKVE